MDEGTRTATSDDPGRRRRILGTLTFVLVAYAGLVAGHRGEFWPFSIFPMFSKAGRPFVHAVVRVVEADEEPVADGWLVAEELPGRPLPLRPLGISQNDFSRLVAPLGESSDAARRRTLATMLAPAAADEAGTLVVFLARGSLGARARPYVRYRAVASVGGRR